jgi:pheromone shutdown protein TraB
MQKSDVNGAEIYFLSIVKGLVSDAEKVRNAFDEVHPDAMAISISKEELACLHDKESYASYEMSGLEEAYRDLLSTFGEVRLPAPGYVEAMDLADAKEVPLIPIDMNEDSYSESYCRNVKGMDWMRENVFGGTLPRRKFLLTSPEDFAKDWDKKVNRSKGFRNLLREREENMAKSLQQMTTHYKRILVVIESERLPGVAARLKNVP